MLREQQLFTGCVSSLARYAERANFHWCCYDQWRFGRIADCKSVMHKTALNNGIIPKDYLVAVAALKTLLVTIALMRTILDLLEVPYHTELPHGGYYMPLLLPILRHLITKKHKE